MKRLYLEISVIYLSFVAALTLYYGLTEIFNLIAHLPYLYLISIISLYPILHWKNFNYRIHAILICILLTVAALLLSSSVSFETRDIMGGFSLILASSLLFYSIKDTLKEFYSGLSFYMVGLFLLLIIGVMHILILLADILDYYILCIGENCSAYTFTPRPEYLLFFLSLFALYPFFHRFEFRRKSE
ncbi:hypothetical protein B6U71_03250 [Euryarchaeota archaeon ex4484_178]|nr:MAG: hypothetical protein B6U71_03250 [Euryarchaeota archaeon ex4484_178]